LPNANGENKVVSNRWADPAGKAGDHAQKIAIIMPWSDILLLNAVNKEGKSEGLVIC
jgi:hypothetical protein